MTSYLETVRKELAQAELDDGLVVFGWLMLGTVLGLLTLARALSGGLSWLVAGPIVAALIGLGPVIRAWQRRRRRRRLEARFGLDWATLQQAAAAAELAPELVELVGTGCRVVLVVLTWVRHDRWQRAGLDLQAEAAALCASFRALLDRAIEAQSLYELSCRPHGDAVAAPYRQAVEDLDRRVSAMEDVLLAVSDGLGAMIQYHGSYAGGVESKLRRMSEGLAELNAAAHGQRLDGRPEEPAWLQQVSMELRRQREADAHHA